MELTTIDTSNRMKNSRFTGRDLFIAHTDELSFYVNEGTKTVYVTDDFRADFNHSLLDEFTTNSDIDNLEQLKEAVINYDGVE